jgi:hypothetical protein
MLDSTRLAGPPKGSLPISLAAVLIFAACGASPAATPPPPPASLPSPSASAPAPTSQPSPATATRDQPSPEAPPDAGSEGGAVVEFGAETYVLTVEDSCSITGNEVDARFDSEDGLYARNMSARIVSTQQQRQVSVVFYEESGRTELWGFDDGVAPLEVSISGGSAEWAGELTLLRPDPGRPGILIFDTSRQEQSRVVVECPGQ